MCTFALSKGNDGIWAQGTKNLLSGLAKFTACPERKKEVANGDKARPKQKRKRNKKKINKAIRTAKQEGAAVD